MVNLTHARVLLGAVWYDLHVVAVHIVAEEIIEVRLWPLTPEHVETAVSLFREDGDIKKRSYDEHWDLIKFIRGLSSQQQKQTHSVEEHAVSDAGLDVFWPGVTRVFPQEAPRSCLAVISVEATELGLWRPAVLHTAITRQDSTTKRVDHVLLRVHAHLQEEQRDEGRRKQEAGKFRQRTSWFLPFVLKD